MGMSPNTAIEIPTLESEALSHSLIQMSLRVVQESQLTQSKISTSL